MLLLLQRYIASSSRDVRPYLLTAQAVLGMVFTSQYSRIASGKQCRIFWDTLRMHVNPYPAEQQQQQRRLTEHRDPKSTSSEESRFVR